ncbi:histone deacetylase 11 isoform X2 [Pleuronectes platessa]|uniref:histone deacetylase 11 isoform X2 n=1 Tax=Pleuronectes platessa TaxID=8262 RepID=UPI00232A4871|nr:histone deacetylase 11 isoform X2 [Pleuronectes platessa]
MQQCPRNMSHKEDSEGKSSHPTGLYASIPRTCLPIVYHPDYNITFMGLEKLHPFDSGKWGKVIRFLKEEQFLTDGNIVEALEATEEDLLVVHTKSYLNRLKWSVVVATITEIPPLMCLPNFLVQRRVLRPLRTQTGGTIMAGKLAVDRGWAINVGGGFHHCSSDKGGGFCAYADITLAIKFLFERVEGISRATIIDLDAHQGNGHERDFMDDSRVFIMDVYNRNIYPRDGFAKRAIKRKVELDWGTEDSEYLRKVELHFEGTLNEVQPDIIIYNAGTDILDGDPLGGLSISPQILLDAPWQGGGVALEASSCGSAVHMGRDRLSYFKPDRCFHQTTSWSEEKTMVHCRNSAGLLIGLTFTEFKGYSLV